MNWLESVVTGVKGLRVHKIRAVLSMLGIIFGVGSVVAVLSVMEGAKSEMMKQLKALGGNNIMVHARSLSQENARKLPDVPRGLRAEEGDRVASQSALVEAHAPLDLVSAEVSRGTRIANCDVVGTTPAFIEVSGFQVMEGRFFVPSDERECRRVCVLEDAVRRQLFPLEDPVGEKILIEHEYYLVVGVLAGKEMSESKFKIVDINRLNRRIYIPLSCSLHRVTQSSPGHQIDQIHFKIASAEHLEDAAGMISHFFEIAHAAEDVPGNLRDYEVKIAMDLFKQTQQTQLIFNIVMGSSAGISLLVGGIGIMNIMLANVTERRREIGIRRSVGARELDILRQFLIEALGICLFGGLVGVLFGFGLTWGIAEFAKWKTLLSMQGIALSLIVSLTDGLIFGTYPAWKAAKMDPIEALRYE